MKERDREREGVGEGEKEKREGERVMIKLHCEPSCVLSLRAKQQLRPEGLRVQRSRQKKEALDLLG